MCYKMEAFVSGLFNPVVQILDRYAEENHEKSNWSLKLWNTTVKIVYLGSAHTCKVTWIWAWGDADSHRVYRIKALRYSFACKTGFWIVYNCDAMSTITEKKQMMVSLVVKASYVNEMPWASNMHNFDPDFVPCFPLLYVNSGSCIIHNGFYSNFFQEGVSCRQEDLLSL